MLSRFILGRYVVTIIRLNTIKPTSMGAFASRSFLSKQLFKSATEKLDLKNRLSVAACDRKHANIILQPKVGVSVLV